MDNVWRYSVIRASVPGEVEKILNDMSLKGWEPIQMSSSDGQIVVLCRKSSK